LNGDGLAEVAISRVLGEPRTMIRLLGGSRPAAAAPRAVFFGGYPQLHLENNRFVSVLGDRGCGAEIRETRDLDTLARSELIILAGHGDPNGWYGATIGPSAFVTASILPELPLLPPQPIPEKGLAFHRSRHVPQSQWQRWRRCSSVENRATLQIRKRRPRREVIAMRSRSPPRRGHHGVGRCDEGREHRRG